MGCLNLRQLIRIFLIELRRKMTQAQFAQIAARQFSQKAVAQCACNCL